VVVRNGATVVFSDNFEAASAAPQWSDGSINSDAPATLGRFSGRFNTTSQQLALSGLSAGQTYTLSFDLLVLDNWHGNNPATGPNMIKRQRRRREPTARDGVH
jgi:hypothetical protein